MSKLSSFAFNTDGSSVFNSLSSSIQSLIIDEYSSYFCLTFCPLPSLSVTIIISLFINWAILQYLSNAIPPTDKTSIPSSIGSFSYISM